KKLVVSSEQREVIDLLTQLSETAAACAHESDRHAQISLGTRESLSNPEMEAPRSEAMHCSSDSDMTSTTCGGTKADGEQEQAAQTPQSDGCAATKVLSPQSDDGTTKEPMHANSSPPQKKVTT